MESALKHLKILDLSMNLPGPYMTWLLSSLGAEVIKIENPNRGDSLRHLGNHPKATLISPFFEAVNRNKKSLTLNLKKAKGKQIFFKLLEHYDIVVEGFRPGTMERLGIGFEPACAVQPRLIQVSVSGYGQEGPSRMRAGYDLNQLALTGVLSITGTRSGQLAIPGIQIADMAGGSLMALAALLAAIIQRGKTGKGQFVDVSIFDGTLSLTTMVANAVEAGLEEGRPGAMMLNGGAPCISVYETKDRRHMALSAAEPKFWSNFCSAIGRKDLESNQFGGEKTKQELIKIFSTQTQGEWICFFAKVDTPCEPVLNLEEAIKSDLTKTRDMSCFNAQGRQLLRSPFKLESSPVQVDLPAPQLGQHTNEILSVLGYGKNDIETLFKEGVI